MSKTDPDYPHTYLVENPDRDDPDLIWRRCDSSFFEPLIRDFPFMVTHRGKVVDRVTTSGITFSLFESDSEYLQPGEKIVLATLDFFDVADAATEEAESTVVINLVEGNGDVTPIPVRASK